MSGTKKLEKILKHCEGNAWVIFLFFCLLVVWFQFHLLNYKQSETIVTAKMIASGMTLYSEIFNHHGPLTFLSGVVLELISSFKVSAHRVPIMLLQWCALAAIYTSPMLRGEGQKKLCVAVIATAMMRVMPSIYGHTYMYQCIAGLLMIIVLCQYTMPAITCPEKLTKQKIFLGNIILVSLPFLAVTYAPFSALVFLASLRNDLLKNALIASLAGLTANLIFLALIASFPGYVVTHFYINGVILPLFSQGSNLVNFFRNIFPDTQTKAKYLLLVVLALCTLLVRERKYLPWRSILLAIAIISLLIRGWVSLHGISFFYASFAILIILAPTKIKPIFVYLTLIICGCLLLSHVPKKEKIPSSTEFSELVKKVTNKDDRIIAYTFQNYEYIASERLPASGHFFYLPWQEKYNENPKWGIKIDACKDIDHYRPKVMLIDKWKVWDRFEWNSYAGCVQKLIDKYYVQLPNTPYYLRQDIYDKYKNTPENAHKL